MPETLSQSDIARLMADRSTPVQLEVVHKLTAQYVANGEGSLTREEQAIADHIFNLLLKNAEVQVRSALSANLSQTAKLPADIARKIAGDANNDVAKPMLENSAVLSDADLLAIIGADANTDKLEAIARRQIVSEAVSDALVDTRIESVVKTVVVNEGATISPKTFDKIVEQHSESVEVMGSMFQRSSVPPAIVEKVIERISETVRASLETQYGDIVEIQAFKHAFDQSLELASLTMLGFHSTNNELMRVLDHMDGSNKVTPFSALSMANLELFEISLARLLKVPTRNIKILLGDPAGFRSAYVAAELPEFLFEAAEITLRAIQQVEWRNFDETGEHVHCTPFEAMQEMRELAAGKDVDGLDYMYALMTQSSHKAH